MEGPALRGVSPDMETVGNAVVHEGRFFTDGENQHKMDVAVIGHNVAQALFPNRAALGKDIEVSGNKLQVIGVLEKYKEGPFGEANREDAVIMIPYGAFRKHYPWADDHFIAVEAKIEDEVPRRRGQAPDRSASPRTVQPGAEKVVEEVVTVGDRREHLANGVGIPHGVPV